MRITNKIMTNTYLRTLNQRLSGLSDLSEKVASGRSYLKASENPAVSLKAMKVRQNLSRLSKYQENLSDANGVLTNVDSALESIGKILSDVNEKIIEGKSDNKSPSERTIYAESMRSYQSELLDVANSRISGNYIFGGTKQDEVPFTVEGGVMKYHGVDVSTSDPDAFPEETMYIDVGMGMVVDDATGKVKEGTAMNVLTPGYSVLGTGTDADGLSGNLYLLFGQIADAFENDDMSRMDQFMSKLEGLTEDVSICRVGVGQKQSFIGFMSGRYTTLSTNEKTSKSLLEDMDIAEGKINYETQKVAYQSALAMGSSVIQTSLLDYLR